MNKHLSTIHGYNGEEFTDSYNQMCSIQESSALEPHIWLGINYPDHKVIWSDAIKLGMDVPHRYGWYDYKLPEEVKVFSRMHLNQEQARDLANALLYFADNGVLPNSEVCKCYKIENNHSVCYGTKEKDACSCKGNRALCNFYKLC